MAGQYQPKRFFRNVPNRFLQEYFARRDLMADMDFASLTETKVEPIYEAWLQLPENVRNDIEQEFQEVDELATEGGTKAILDEACWHGEDLAPQFAKLESFHERAFWTCLERPRYWPGAVAFGRADRIPSSYWRKRKNLPRKAARVDPADIRDLERNLGRYFHTMQGRGQNCRVDCYRRHRLDYFFAYPEDYAQASVEWEQNVFQRRPRHPAFEIIFVYSQEHGTLDVFLSGDRKPVPDLQAIFAGTILGAELGADPKDERVYDLDALRSRHFRFTYGPESAIESVDVKKLRLTFHGTRDRIVLEVDPSGRKDAIFDLLDKVTSGIKPARTSITQVGIKVVFAPVPGTRRPVTRTFDVTWPNSCSLKHDVRDLILRKMLADSWIEPREPTREGSKAA
jgi:hypothetical protein